MNLLTSSRLGKLYIAEAWEITESFFLHLHISLQIPLAEHGFLPDLFSIF